LRPLVVTPFRPVPTEAFLLARGVALEGVFDARPPVAVELARPPTVAVRVLGLPAAPDDERPAAEAPFRFVVSSPPAEALPRLVALLAGASFSDLVPLLAGAFFSDLAPFPARLSEEDVPVLSVRFVPGFASSFFARFVPDPASSFFARFVPSFASSFFARFFSSFASSLDRKLVV